MRERPGHVPHDKILALVRREWDSDVGELEHLPVGFGAHHWAASVDGLRTLFVTFDGLLPRHTAEELEAAYLLARLHATAPPSRTPEWRPLVEATFADDLVALLEDPWQTGPYGVPARQALVERLRDISRWTDRYHSLAEAALAEREAWVPTHGEPDTANHLVTATRRYLVDWESLKLAPRERDLRNLPEVPRWSGPRPADPRMLEMFDLEWRLDEISQYAAGSPPRTPGTAATSSRSPACARSSRVPSGPAGNAARAGCRHTASRHADRTEPRGRPIRAAGRPGGTLCPRVCNRGRDRRHRAGGCSTGIA